VSGESGCRAGVETEAPEAKLADRLRSADLRERMALDLRGASLAQADLSNLDLSGLDLSEAELQGADLSGTRLMGTTLRGAILREARLERAELLGADLADADLTGCRAEGAGFGGADLTDARLSDARLKGASFSQARLGGVEMRCADLCEARLLEADLSDADLQRCDLRNADLSNAHVGGANFSHCDLRGARFSELDGFETARWISVDLRDADLRGAVRIRRFILDENYLHEFRTGSKASAALYKIWSLSSDCGRSFGRFGLWVALIVVLFGGLYGMVDVDYGDHATPLSPVYFSIVTLTTLGYGDAVPGSLGAQLVVMLEVVVGYLALGGLISIFANKMARRAD